jgi:hypothetical protein
MSAGEVLPLPPRNVQFDLTTAQILSDVYKTLLNPPTHFNSAKDFWRSVFENLVEAFASRRNITVTFEQAKARHKSAVQLAHIANHQKTNDKELKESCEALERTQKLLLREFLQLEARALNELVIHDELCFPPQRSSSAHSQIMDGNQPKRRRRQDSASPPMLNGSASPRSTVPRDMEDHFIELSGDLDAEGRVTTRPLSVGNLVKYLFEVIDAQKEELGALKRQIQDHGAKLDKVLGAANERSPNGRPVTQAKDASAQAIDLTSHPQEQPETNPPVEQFEFADLLKSMN